MPDTCGPLVSTSEPGKCWLVSCTCLRNYTEEGRNIYGYSSWLVLLCAVQQATDAQQEIEARVRKLEGKRKLEKILECLQLCEHWIGTG